MPKKRKYTLQESKVIYDKALDLLAINGPYRDPLTYSPFCCDCIKRATRAHMDKMCLNVDVLRDFPEFSLFNPTVMERPKGNIGWWKDEQLDVRRIAFELCIAMCELEIERLSKKK